MHDNSRTLTAFCRCSYYKFNFPDVILNVVYHDKLNFFSQQHKKSEAKCKIEMWVDIKELLLKTYFNDQIGMYSKSASLEICFIINRELENHPKNEFKLSSEHAILTIT